MKCFYGLAALILLSTIPIAAQKPDAASAAPSGTSQKHQNRMPEAAAKCHRLLDTLDGKGFDYFEGKNLEELNQLRESVDACVRDHYEGLPKFDLVLATVATGWIQELIDTREVVIKQPSAVTKPSTPAPEQTTRKENADDNPLLPKNGYAGVFPLDLGQSFPYITFGSKTLACEVSSANRLRCREPGVQFDVTDFIAVLLDQQNRQFLIACAPDSYQSCAAPAPGVYSIWVHGRSVALLDSGVSRVNIETGKNLGEITPTFTVLQRTK